MGIDNLKHDNKRKVIISVLKILLLIAIVAGIPLYIYFFQGDWLKQFEGFDDVVAYLQRYKWESVPIYIGLQVLQIVISVIPGQVFQFAAGYLYSFFPALLFSICGAFIGTTLSFYLAKMLGRDFVHLFFGREKTHEYVQKLNSKRAYMIVFILYLIPGLPKDVVSYAAGVFVWLCLHDYIDRTADAFMFCCRILAPNLGRGQHKIIFTIIIILFALLIFLGCVL